MVQSTGLVIVHGMQMAFTGLGVCSCAAAKGPRRVLDESATLIMYVMSVCRKCVDSAWTGGTACCSEELKHIILLIMASVLCLAGAVREEVNLKKLAELALPGMCMTEYSTQQTGLSLRAW